VLGRLNNINSEADARKIRTGQKLILPNLILPNKVYAQQTNTDNTSTSTAPPVLTPNERAANIGVIIDKLTQESPLSGPDILALQRSLINIGKDLKAAFTPAASPSKAMWGLYSRRLNPDWMIGIKP